MSSQSLIIAGVAVVVASLLICGFAVWRANRLSRALRNLRAACLALAADASAEFSPQSGEEVAALAATLAKVALARDEAIKASQSGRQFLAAASHDLRQPLQALGLFAATLSQRPLAPPERAIVDKIEGALEALEHLLDTLLDISRLDAGVVKAHRAIFPVQDLFERLALEFVPLAEHKGLRLRFVPTSAMTESDPDLLERILRNLLANAIRYTTQGGVVLGARRRGEELAIEVWDSGSGIPTDKMQEIFREFSQLSTASRDRHRGLGLGLAIVDRLVTLLGHRVELTSSLGKGSVFRVLLPRAEEEWTESDGSDEEMEGKTGHPGGEKIDRVHS